MTSPRLTRRESAILAVYEALKQAHGDLDPRELELLVDDATQLPAFEAYASGSAFTLNTADIIAALPYGRAGFILRGASAISHVAQAARLHAAELRSFSRTRNLC